MIKALWVIMALTTLSGEAKVTLESIGPVTVQFVSSDHWLLKDGSTAKAARSGTGEKWILVNVDADMEGIDQIILHEMAHHAAWDRYGEKIKQHGPKFRAICRQLVTVNPAYYCKGD